MLEDNIPIAVEVRTTNENESKSSNTVNVQNVQDIQNVQDVQNVQDIQNMRNVLVNEDDIVKYFYLHNIKNDDDRFLKYELSMCEKENLTNYNWLNTFPNTENNPYFFYKALVGDVDNLMEIFGMYQLNMLSIYNENDMNVLNYLSATNCNNELLIFVDKLKNKYNLKFIFKSPLHGQVDNSKRLNHIINVFIKNKNSRIFDLFKYLLKEGINKFEYFMSLKHDILNVSKEEYKKFKDYEIKNNKILEKRKEIDIYHKKKDRCIIS